MCLVSPFTSATPGLSGFVNREGRLKYLSVGKIKGVLPYMTAVCHGDTELSDDIPADLFGVNSVKWYPTCVGKTREFAGLPRYNFCDVNY